MKKVILFDSKYLLYRQHFAHKALQAGTFPTGGMFGFWNEVLRMQENWPGWSMVFCWDGQGPGWRDEKKKLTGYKENREQTEDTRKVHQQEQVLKKLLHEMGFWTPQVAGIEGDDLIAVLSGSWPGVDSRRDLLIYSGDQDMYQLVSEGIRVLSPRKIKQKGNEPPADLVLDERMVVSVMGVMPDQVSELRAMAGDPADNLKGLPGIGPKRAFDLYAMGVRPSLEWHQMNWSAQQQIADLKAEWPRVRQEYRLVKLPRVPDWEGFTVEQQGKLEELVNSISAAPERRKRDKDERQRAWLTFLGRYEMKELFEVRNRVWLVP